MTIVQAQPGVTWRGPRLVVCAPGSARLVGEMAASYGSSTLLVLDPAVLSNTHARAAVDSLRSSGLHVDEYLPDTTEVPLTEVDACVAAASPSVSSIVALGGGSALDLAKLASLVIGQGGSALDRVEGRVRAGNALPVIAVPTTAGTGSEVTAIAVVGLGDGRKQGIVDRNMVPDVALCDSLLSHSCSPSVTAHSGVDALCHAVEAFTAPYHPSLQPEQRVSQAVGKNVRSDEHARAAMRSIAWALPRAVSDGADGEAREAREAMTRAALDAGLAFGLAGVGVVHALQYALSSVVRHPHGLGVGVVLPAALLCLRPWLAEELEELGRIVSPGTNNPDFIAWLLDTYDTIGMPRSITQLGIDAAAVADVAGIAEKMSRLVSNSRGPGGSMFLSKILMTSIEMQP